MSRLAHKLHLKENPYGKADGPTLESAGSWFTTWRANWRSQSAAPGETNGFDFGAEAEKAIENAGDVRAVIEESSEVPNDPLLDAGVLRALNVKLNGKLVRAGLWFQG
jgi:hypothetical protein